MKKVVLFLGIAILLIGFTGRSNAEEKEIFAKVGDKVITRADFDNYLKVYASKDRFDVSKPGTKENILKVIVSRMALAEIAMKKGLDRTEETKKAVELAVNSVLSAVLIDNEVTQKISVTEDDIQLYYKMKQDEFRKPEMVRARHILVKVDKNDSEDDKKKAKEKAEELLKRIKAGEDFAKLATEFSDDRSSKPKGGDLGFFPKGKTVKPFEDAAFSLKPGEISDVVESKFGYHIISVEEKKDESLQPLEELKGKIKQKIFEERRASMTKDYMEQAMKDANVEIYPEKLKDKK